MIGVDCSEEMLDAAMEKREESGHDILYLLQDIQATTPNGCANLPIWDASPTSTG